MTTIALTEAISSVRAIDYTLDIKSEDVECPSCSSDVVL